MYEEIGVKNFEILQHTFARQKDRIPAAEEALKLILPAYIGKSGKRLIVQPNVLSSWTHIPSIDSLREQAIQFSPFPFVDAGTVKMQLPTGYSVEHLPETIQVKSAFGKYEASFIQQGETIFSSGKCILMPIPSPKRNSPN